MAVDKNSPIPLYQQVALAMKEKIDSGEYRQGLRLPPQRELAEEHGVSMVTLRQAVVQLESEGVIVAKQGKGTFVASGNVSQSLGKLRSLSEVLQASGFAPSVEIDSFEFRTAPDSVARDLKLPLESRVMEICRRHLVDGTPLAYAVIYVPESISRSLTREAVQRFPIYTIYEEQLGIQLGQAIQHIRAVGASERVAKALDILVGTPTLSAQWVARNTEGTPVEWIHIFYRADFYEFVIEVHRNGLGDPTVLTAAPRVVRPDGTHFEG